MTLDLPQPLSRVPVTGSIVGGKYRVIRQIGEGGMGVVLEAEHTQSGKRVAIKWLRPSMATHSNAIERMLREARACARIRHPNVVDVYDIMQEHDAVFLVMELLEGESLTEAIDRGALPAHTLIALLLEAMRGVANAHDQGVVHRDIKPDNIFLANQPDRTLPTPKVLDFGISKLMDGEGPDLTRTGVTLGTPMYMSYEQLSGARDLDRRADVYAFGVILYEALTGQAPFDAETVPDLIVQIATTQPPSPKTLRPNLPAGLDRVVRRAMAKERSARFPTLDVLVAELAPFASARAFAAAPGGDVGAPAALGSTLPTAPSRSSGTRRLKLLWAGLGLSLMIAIATIGWLAASSRSSSSQRGPGPAPAHPRTAAAPPQIEHAANPSPTPSPAPSPTPSPTRASETTRSKLSTGAPHTRPAPAIAPRNSTLQQPPDDTFQRPRLRAGVPRRQDF